MTVRHSFVEHFGEDQATKIEEASLTHMQSSNVAHKEDKWGSDPFQYHLLACIGSDCFTVQKNRDYHGITIPLEELRAWVLEFGDLHAFEGDLPDYLALFVGAYNSWINWEKAGVEPPADMAENDAELNRWRSMSMDEALEEMKRMAEEMMGSLNDHGDFEGEH